MWRILALGTGIAVFGAGMANAFAPSTNAALMFYLSSIAYHFVIIFLLVRYTFSPRKVLTEMLLAATCLYHILGSIFAANFALILWFEPGAFVSSLGDPVQWQQLLHYSYVTLTTLGYGDILPATFHARGGQRSRRSSARFTRCCWGLGLSGCMRRAGHDRQGVK